MEDKIRKLCARVKIFSAPNNSCATSGFKARGTFEPLRGHSPIKLAAGNNPSITISIFPMPIAPALGRTLLAFLSLHTQFGLFHFPENELF
jgi:hypothetical protein